jgi:hypothetical protein
LRGEVFEPFRNGAPVREWFTSRECAGLPCESGALFARGGLGAFSKRSSRARVVHFAGVRGARMREWCTFCEGRFSSFFETELPCESGALRGSAWGSLNQSGLGIFCEKTPASFCEKNPHEKPLVPTVPLSYFAKTRGASGPPWHASGRCSVDIIPGSLLEWLVYATIRMPC